MRNLLTILLFISNAYGQEVCPPPPKNIISEKVEMGVLDPIPVLNSDITQAKTLWLNFGGAIVINPNWNNGIQLDLAPSALTTQQMTEVFNIVAEDMKPFLFNVSTDQAKYLSAPDTAKQQIIITPTSGWYQVNAGGVAYVGTFIGANTPGFVFSDRLGYVDKYIGEACSHESGHTLSLRHQYRYNSTCGVVENYHSGFGPYIGQPEGDVGFAPIMGVSYQKQKTTWFKGKSQLGCNVDQDDTLDIVTKSKLGLRQKSGGIATSNFTAFIRHGQTSTFSLFVPVQAIVKIRASKVNGNLDSKITINNQSFSLPDSLASTATITLNAGTYPLQISGEQGPYAPNYGNAGEVNISIVQEPITIVPNRTDSQYVNRRTERWQYTVWTMQGQKVKRAYGELGRATDNLTPGIYIIKFGIYTNQIIKQ